MAGWFNREINSLADLDGLKMRIPGIGGEVVSRVGVEAVNIPGGELYTSMQTGVIDATEWVGPTMTWLSVFTKWQNIIITPVGTSQAPLLN